MIRKWWIVNIVVMIALIFVLRRVFGFIGINYDVAASLLIVGAFVGVCAWYITNWIVKK